MQSVTNWDGIVMVVQDCCKAIGKGRGFLFRCVKTEFVSTGQPMWPFTQQLVGLLSIELSVGPHIVHK